jgi:hypothetical protein
LVETGQAVSFQTPYEPLGSRLRLRQQPGGVEAEIGVDAAPAIVSAVRWRDNARVSRAELTVVPDVDRELGELYGLPLDRFTAARNDLSKRLRKAGQTAEAERVAALAKPSISAWAVNQLARREADRVEALLQAGEQLVEAQKEALAGKASDRFDQASRHQREAIRALVPAATQLLIEAGHRPSDAVKERIAGSLRAASVDPDARRLLASGRLQEDAQSAGLDLLAGLAPMSRTRATVSRPSEKRREARLREARDELAAAREQERRLTEETAVAEREAEEAAGAAKAAADRARALATDATRARKTVEKAEKALRRLEQSTRGS